MAIVENHHHRHKSHSDVKLFALCPFWQSGGQTSSSSSSTQNLQGHVDGSKSKPKTVSSVARSLLPPRRRLRLDPANKLYFPCTSSFFFSFLRPRWLRAFGHFYDLFSIGFGILTFPYSTSIILKALLKNPIILWPFFPLHMLLR